MSESDRGQERGLFPATRLSAIEAAQSHDPELRQRAQERIAAVYWKPIYLYLRLKHRCSPDLAEDLTQEFFAQLLARQLLAKYEPAKGRLRGYLRVCVDGLVANTRRDRARLKRGGGAAPISLDFRTAEAELNQVAEAADLQPDQLFEREWMRSVLARAIQRLSEECFARGKAHCFALFEQYDLEPADPPPTYQQLAERFALSVSDVTNALAFARRELRRIVGELIRDTTANEEECRSELRTLFGGPST
jgi:RNA polymerase sigma factor (sigma-70 family)